MADIWESTVHQTNAENEYADFHRHQDHKMTSSDYENLSMVVEKNQKTMPHGSTLSKTNSLSTLIENAHRRNEHASSFNVNVPSRHETTNSLKTTKEVIKHRKEAPLQKLSSGLLNTYLSINEKYYASLKKRNAAKEAAAAAATEGASLNEHKVPYEYKSTNDSAMYDDKNCDYIIRVGEIWDNRYEVLKVLGRGSFGQVVEAYDAIHKEHVAIKIIKNKRAFYHQALLEIRILQYLNANDKKDQNHIVRMKRHFEWRNHLCISYELLSMNLYDLLRNQNFAGVSLNLVRKFAVQILTALRFLSRSDISIVHCDLKPENIVLKNSKRSALKLIDFGSSCFSHQKTYSYIQSRFYRSPEVLLGVPYQTSIDMWSLGCLLVEMHTGQPLFDGLTEHEQICKLADVLGPPPTSLFSRACLKKRNVMYKQHSNGAYAILPCKTFVPRNKSLNDVVKDKMYSIAAATNQASHKNSHQQHELNGGSNHCATGVKNNRQAQVANEVEQDYDLFLDLIRRMLQYNPDERITPTEALEHPWLSPSAAPAVMTSENERSQSLSLQSSAQATCDAISSHHQQQQPLMKRVEKFTTGLSWNRKR